MCRGSALTANLFVTIVAVIICAGRNTGDFFDIFNRIFFTDKRVIGIVEISVGSVIGTNNDVAGLCRNNCRIIGVVCGIDSVTTCNINFQACAVVEVDNSTHTGFICTNDRNAVIVAKEFIRHTIDIYCNLIATFNSNSCIIQIAADFVAVIKAINCGEMFAVAGKRYRFIIIFVDFDFIAVKAVKINIAVIVNEYTVKAVNARKFALTTGCEAEVFVAVFKGVRFAANNEVAIAVCSNSEVCNINSRLACNVDCFLSFAFRSGTTTGDNNAVFAIFVGDVDCFTVDSDRTFSNNHSCRRTTDYTGNRTAGRYSSYGDNLIRINCQGNIVANAAKRHMLCRILICVDIESSRYRVKGNFAVRQICNTGDRCRLYGVHNEFYCIVSSICNMEALTACKVEVAVLIGFNSSCTSRTVDGNNTAGIADFSNLGDSVAKIIVPIIVTQFAFAEDSHCTFVVANIELDFIDDHLAETFRFDPAICTNAANFSYACSAGCLKGNVGISAGFKGLTVFAESKFACLVSDEVACAAHINNSNSRTADISDNFNAATAAKSVNSQFIFIAGNLDRCAVDLKAFFKD